MKITSPDYPDGIEITFDEVAQEVDALIAMGWAPKTFAALVVVREALIRAGVIKAAKEAEAEVSQ
jgi:hypothetical protein